MFIALIGRVSKELICIFASVSIWLSLDPLQAKYPSLSPYNFAGNSPVLFVDPNGKEIQISSLQRLDKNDRPVFETVTYRNGKLFQNGKVYTGDNKYIKTVALNLDKLRSMNEASLNTMLDKLETSKKIHTIQDYNPNPMVNNDQVHVGETENGSYLYQPFLNVTNENYAHELKHNYDIYVDKKVYIFDGKKYGRHEKVGENGVKAWEIEAVQLQNVWRNNQCMPNKAGYGGAQIQSQHQNINSTTMSNNESSEGNNEGGGGESTRGSGGSSGSSSQKMPVGVGGGAPENRGSTTTTDY